jgi:hypothetical protein
MAGHAALALGAGRSRRTLWAALARLALDAAPDLQRQEDVGGRLKTFHRSHAHLAASLAEGKLLAGLGGPSCAGSGLLDNLLFADLGHGSLTPGRLKTG